MKTIKTAFLLILVITFFIACSSDDESVASVPTVAYSTTTTINATLFKEGSSIAPTINWNGEQGSFSLASPINGLSINSNTGILSWTKELALNTSIAEVIATNSAGQTLVSITINNPFQGVFLGGYNDDPLSTILTSNEEYTFSSDFSLVRSGDLTGTYTLSGTSIATFSSGLFETLELSYTAAEVKLTGYWSSTIENPSQTNADGYTELSYEE